MSAERVTVRRLHIGDVVNFDAADDEHPDHVGVWRQVSEIITAAGRSKRIVVAADANDTDAAFDVAGSAVVWRNGMDRR